MSAQPHENETAQHLYGVEEQPDVQALAGHNPMLSSGRVADSVALSNGLVNGSVDPRDPRVTPVDLLTAGKIIAPHLREEGINQVHAHLIKGETEAIHGVLGTLVDPTNANMMLDSEFGAGKSTTFEGIFRLIEGLDHIAYVPGRPDLTPEELTGRQKTMANTRTVPATVEGEDDESVVEYLHGVVYPMVSVDTQALVMDEINLNNPRTMSAANSILAKRMLETTRGEHQPMDKLEVALTAKNPRSSDPTLPRLRQSFVDRFSRGVILGRESEWTNTLAAMGADFEPQPEAVQPVITLAMLHVAQAAVEHVTMRDREADAARRGAVAIAYILRDPRWVIPVRTTPYRLFSHIRSVARTEALMDGRDAVEGQDIGRAIRTKLTAALTGNDMVEDYDQVDDTVNEVVGNVTPKF